MGANVRVKLPNSTQKQSRMVDSTRFELVTPSMSTKCATTAPTVHDHCQQQAIDTCCPLPFEVFLSERSGSIILMLHCFVKCAAGKAAAFFGRALQVSRPLPNRRHIPAREARPASCHAARRTGGVGGRVPAGAPRRNPFPPARSRDCPAAASGCSEHGPPQSAPGGRLPGIV